MNKETFLAELEKAMPGLPQADAAERLAFYGEMIDDRVEEGATEEEAVAGIGAVDEIVSQIAAETSLTKLVREKVAPKRKLRAWEIVLIVLGSPVWLPLLIAAGAVILSLCVVVWSLIASLWAIEVSLWACAAGGVVLAVVCAVRGNAAAAVATLGMGSFCAGLSVFLFCGCAAATKGLARLAKNAVLGFKSRLVGKERTK